jgi:secreted Zn-dependent insulinase-like peptidase
MDLCKIFPILFLILCLPLAFCSNNQLSSKKSNGIINDVLKLDLPNKMQVVIFQSPLVSKTSISLNHKFSWLDEEIPGLLSLYMNLILNKSINMNSKLQNYSIFGSTCYYQDFGVHFDFDSYQIEEALCMLASSFTNPGFYTRDNIDEDIAEGIKNITQLYENKKKDRIIDQMASLIQGRPFSDHYMGYAQSLLEVSKKSLADALRKLHETKISSGQMKAVILTPRPISEIKNHVFRYLSFIPYRWGVIPKTTEFVNKRAIEFRSENGNSILIQLPISFDRKFPHHLRLFNYLTFLLGSKTEGTWLHQLQGKIYSGQVLISHEMFGDCLCIVNIHLKFLDGVDNLIIKKVLTSFQKYLSYLQTQAANKDLYEEYRNILRIEIAQNVINSVVMLDASEQMHYNQRIDDWFSCDELVFDANEISQFFSTIDPTLINIIMGWGKLNVQNFTFFDNHSNKVYENSPNNFDDLLLKNFNYKPQLPTENGFTSSLELSCLPSSKSFRKYSSPTPLLPYLWFMNKFSGKSTESTIFIRLFILNEMDIKHRIMLGTFFEIIKSDIFIKIDQAKRAGIIIDIQLSNFHSIDISIYGLGDKAPLKKLLSCLLKTIKIFLKKDSEMWEEWRSSYEAQRRLIIPYSDFYSPNSIILQFLDRKLSYEEQEDSLNAIKKVSDDISFDDFMKFILQDSLFEKCFSNPHIFVAGSTLGENYAKKIHTLITSVFKGNEKLKSECTFKNQILLPVMLSKEIFTLKSYMSQSETHKNAFSLTFCHVFCKLFSEKLGPKDKWDFPPRLTIGICLNEVSLYFYLHCTATRETLWNYIQDFLKHDALDYLNSLTDPQLQAVFDSFRQILLKDDDQFYSFVQNHWFSLTTFNLDPRNLSDFFGFHYSVDEFRSDVKNFIKDNTW